MAHSKARTGTILLLATVAVLFSVTAPWSARQTHGDAFITSSYSTDPTTHQLTLHVRVNDSSLGSFVLIVIPDPGIVNLVPAPGRIRRTTFWTAHQVRRSRSALTTCS
jgi:hypothetical protein